jgi:hypothetical protein
MALKPEIPNNELPLLPPNRDAIETKAILRQESKAAVGHSVTTFLTCGHYFQYITRIQRTKAFRAHVF